MRTAVDQLLRRAEVTEPPTPLDVVGSFCGVVRTETVAMSDAGRLISLPNGGYVVQVNQADSQGRQRFSTAHEICHTLFNQFRRTTRSHDDPTTGMFAGKGEEYLCDIGAAHLLLHASWVRDLASGCKPSLDRLLQTARACDASLEATARQIATLGIWNCSFAFWELGYRKSEREVFGRAPLPGFESVAPVPTQKLRVARVYASPGLPFLPPNASTSEESSITEALRTQGSSSAREEFALASGRLVADCESQYVGYRRGDGEVVRRVITMMRWVD